MWLTQNETPGGNEREWVFKWGGTGLPRGRGEMSACSRRDRVEGGYACRQGIEVKVTHKEIQSSEASNLKAGVQLCC